MAIGKAKAKGKTKGKPAASRSEPSDHDAEDEWDKPVAESAGSASTAVAEGAVASAASSAVEEGASTAVEVATAVEQGALAEGGAGPKDLAENQK
eukprot:6785847-Karenia_brevis.AAC.1